MATIENDSTSSGSKSRARTHGLKKTFWTVKKRLSNLYRNEQKPTPARETVTIDTSAKELKLLKSRLSRYANETIKGAKIEFSKGEFIRAEDALRSVDTLIPEETRHLVHYGNVLAAQGRYAEAEVVFRRLVASSPNTISYSHRLADMLAGQKRHEEAVEVLEQFLNIVEEGGEGKVRRRIITHNNIIGRYSPPVDAERQKAVALHQSAGGEMSSVQTRVLEALRTTGFAQTSFDELFAGDRELWDAADQEFQMFASNPDVLELTKKISAAEDFSVDPDLSKLFKPSIINYKYFGNLTAASPVARIYASDPILRIANGYNEMASKIRNMHMWINPPLHPQNVNGRKGSQIWHRDQEDSRILKCFIYFSDIDVGSGATDYLKYTAVECTGLKDEIIPYPCSSGYPNETVFRNRAINEDFLQAEGRKGTIVFLDTNGFHRGGYVRDRSRHIAMCTFLRPVSPFINTNLKVPLDGVDLSRMSQLASYGFL